MNERPRESGSPYLFLVGGKGDRRDEPLSYQALWRVFSRCCDRLGIRTPWTLSNDRVWMRTHRVGGYLLAGAGVALLVAAALPRIWTFALGGAAVVLAAFGSLIYSYFAWKQETSE